MTMTIILCVLLANAGIVIVFQGLKIGRLESIMWNNIVLQNGESEYDYHKLHSDLLKLHADVNNRHSA